MSTAVSASMQAALLIREKQRLRRKKFRKGRSELPSHVATRDIAPFPQYPPGFWVSVLFTLTKKNYSIVYKRNLYHITILYPIAIKYNVTYFFVCIVNVKVFIDTFEMKYFFFRHY